MATADAPHMTFVDAIKAKHDGPLLGAVLTIPNITTAQIAAQSESEFVMIDMEHAPLQSDMVTHMIHAYVAASRPHVRFPLVRIPSHGVEYVKWAMDGGAAGIVIPMVGNLSELRAILKRALYPPQGERSFGPLNAPYADPAGPGGGMAAYFAKAARGDIAILPMIESKEGLENAEELLSMEGVSGVFIGPADLRLSLGLAPAVDGDEPQFVEGLQRIVQIAKKHQKVIGCMGMGEAAARKRASEGMDFLLSTFVRPPFHAGRRLWAFDSHYVGSASADHRGRASLVRSPERPSQSVS